MIVERIITERHCYTVGRLRLWNLVFPLTGCIPLGKSLNFCVLQFSYKVEIRITLMNLAHVKLSDVMGFLL